MRFTSRAFQVMMIISLCIAVAGCAKTLTLQYRPLPDTKNLLASVSPLKVKLADFADKREGKEDPHLVGGIQKKVGSIITDIRSDRSVSEILMEALRDELVRNGHSIVDDNEDVVLKGEIRTFWLGTDVTSEDWDVTGEIEVLLEVIHSRAGASSFIGPYFARTIEKRYLVPVDSVMVRILEKSLSELMQKVRSDPGFATALEKK